jgi:hypothetical protein
MTPNPITQGFRAVLRDPAIYLVEILWRWSFAVVALALLLGVGFILMGPLNLGDAFAFAWRTHDSRKLGFLALKVVLTLGGQLLTAAIALPIAIIGVWSFLSAAGRRSIIKRLAPEAMPLRFGSMLAVQSLRGVLTWMAFLLLLAAFAGGLYVATRGPKPDLLRFYLTVMPAVVVIGASWLALNWYLSVAAIFGREGQSFRGAFRQARQTVRRQRSDFAGAGFVFLLLRVVLLLVALAVFGLTSGLAGSAPQSYFAVMMGLVLFYCAVADFLYVSRTAAYLALAAAHREPDVVELLAASSRLSTRES